METRLIAMLPCAARELESALHSICDHEGLWDGRLEVAETSAAFSWDPGRGKALVLVADERRNP